MTCEMEESVMVIRGVASYIGTRLPLRKAPKLL